MWLEKLFFHHHVDNINNPVFFLCTSNHVYYSLLHYVQLAMTEII